MPNGYPRDGIFNPQFTTIKESHIRNLFGIFIVSHVPARLDPKMGSFFTMCGTLLAILRPHEEMWSRSFRKMTMHADFGLTGILLSFKMVIFICLLRYEVVICSVYKIDKRIIYALKELNIKLLAI